MKRVWIVVLVSLAMLAALWGVRDFDPSAEPSDEILAYEVNAERPVSVTVSGGIEAIVINSWLVVPVSAQEPIFPYGVEVQLLDLNGQQLMSRRFETRSRPPDTQLATAARLADASGWVCEPRSFEFDATSLKGRAGILRVRTLPGEHTTVLLRMTHRVLRGALEQRILERTLGQSEMRRIVAGRSSLGFFDLPLDQRMDALSTWERRLTAQGSEGRDYFTRRLLLGEPVRRARPPRWLEVGLQSSVQQRLALNLTGAFELRVHADPNTEVLVKEGWDETPTSHRVDTNATLDLQFADRGVRTVVLYTASEGRLALSSASTSGWLVAEPPNLIEGRFEVLPDVRKNYAYLLDAVQPLRFLVAPGQEQVGVTLRTVLDPGQAQRSARLTAVWVQQDGRELARSEHTIALELSPFERVSGAPVSERSNARLRVPEGAFELRLTGDRTTALTAFVDEPGVSEEIRRAPYAAEPPAGQQWRYAPPELSPTTTIRPDNLQELRDASRELVLAGQVRLEPSGGAGAALSERVLLARGAPVERPMFVPVTGGSPDATGTWVLLSESRRKAELRLPRIPGLGADDEVAPGAELEWRALLPRQALGSEWALWIDGSKQPAQLGSVQAQRGFFVTTEGAHQVELETDHAMHLALKAQPQPPALGYRLQTVLELKPGARLTFPFERRSSESLNLVVVGLAPKATRAVTLRYQVDAGKPRRHEGFFRRAADTDNAQSLLPGNQGAALLWDTDPSGEAQGSAPLGHLVIQLGDDLAEGSHEVTLQNESNATTWIRAVLAGRIPEGKFQGRAP